MDRMNPRDGQTNQEEREAVDRFFYRLRSMSSYKDCRQFAETRPSKGKPGRSAHSNFENFLSSFAVPNGAALDEALEYQRLFEIFAQEGVVSREAVARLRAAIQLAIDARKRPGGSDI